MNIYYLRVITGNSTLIDIEVKADTISWSDAGLYEFTRLPKGDEKFPVKVAYYPVDRTIIESIDYDVEQ